MSTTNDELCSLLKELAAFPHETEWVEFKHNNADPQEIGEQISALSNSAALHATEAGYIAWGIEDITHAILGTSFKPKQAKKGNEELENWLARLLSPSIDFQIFEFEYGGKPVVLFKIQPAFHRPIRFSGTEFIRSGRYTKKLADFPEKERALWRVFSQTFFEDGIAKEAVSADHVLELIDYPAYFDATKQRLPENRAGIFDRLEREKFVIRKGDDRFVVTNCGAVLFARNLQQFEHSLGKRYASSSTRERTALKQSVSRRR